MTLCVRVRLRFALIKSDRLPEGGEDTEAAIIV